MDHFLLLKGYVIVEWPLETKILLAVTDRKMTLAKINQMEQADDNNKNKQDEMHSKCNLVFILGMKKFGSTLCISAKTVG